MQAQKQRSHPRLMSVDGFSASMLRRISQHYAAIIAWPTAVSRPPRCVERSEPMHTALHPTIILVDDEPAVLAILHRIMHDLARDYDVIPVPDGAAALIQIAQRPVALVITDYQMPDMDGVALTTAINPQAPSCPVV